MKCTRTAAATGVAALLVLTGCSDDGAKTAPSTSPSATTATGTSPHHQAPPPPAAPPTRTVTVAPTQAPSSAPRPTGPGSEYDVPCTGGPDEGTICTNPNHGAGDDPYGTAAPTTSRPG
ncbi:hypothetical protein [Tsukamurella pulmonis]|uniref:hypothetical protein n=1 Tax=Tsukamurella pulmonis TaxID=47312 RepID=UPI00140295D2|nr:hypothetical protein [Tsukamurella pulmonis]